MAPEAVEYVEANAGGCPEDDRREARALAAFFDSPRRTRVCHVGCAKAEVGHAGAASGLVSVAKASLAIYQEIIPPMRGLRKPLPEFDGTGSLSALRVPAAVDSQSELRPAQGWSELRQRGRKLDACRARGK